MQQIIINISEEEYTLIKQKMKLNIGGVPSEAERAIANGTPLTKGNGRLIILSEDAVKKQQTPLSFSCQKWISEVGLSNATIATVEADENDKENIMTRKEIEKVVKEIRGHCRNNNCRTCEARTTDGCVFMSSYPNDWDYIAGADTAENEE